MANFYCLMFAFAFHGWDAEKKTVMPKLTMQIQLRGSKAMRGLELAVDPKGHLVDSRGRTISDKSLMRLIEGDALSGANPVVVNVVIRDEDQLSVQKLNEALIRIRQSLAEKESKLDVHVNVVFR